jgi:hypothetical protein
MLDEIINYVQSLQRQVEVWSLYSMNECLRIFHPTKHIELILCFLQFLSMKLATVNPQLGLGIEGLVSKDVWNQKTCSSCFPFSKYQIFFARNVHHN